MKLYNDIADFPIYNWFKCIDTKDYTWCMVERKECGEADLLKCTEAFSLMYDQYLDTFGVSDTLKDIIDLKNQILVLKIDKEFTGNQFLETIIQLKEIELTDKTETKKQKGNAAKIAIEKMLGFQINERLVSVKSYYEYMLELNNKSE